ncbi:MAG: nucleotidyltransferase [Ferruginibacter sp.]
MKNKMPEFQKDFEDFIKLSNKYNLEYLVIGGFAVSIHGYPRTTKDLDVCINKTEENAKILVEVLNDFGFGSLNFKIEDFLENDMITQLGYAPIRIDILNDLNGIDFNLAFKNKRVVEMNGVPTNFIGYNELLVNKEKAGRDEDMLDIKKLKSRNKNKQ